MAQKMTEENKPFVMATLSGVSYKDPEEAIKTFEHFRFTEHKYIDYSRNCDFFLTFGIQDFETLSKNSRKIFKTLSKIFQNTFETF